MFVLVDELHAAVAERDERTRKVHLHARSGGNFGVELRGDRPGELHLAVFKHLLDGRALALGHFRGEKLHEPRRLRGREDCDGVGAERSALGAGFHGFAYGYGCLPVHWVGLSVDFQLLRRPRARGEAGLASASATILRHSSRVSAAGSATVLGILKLPPLYFM